MKLLILLALSAMTSDAGASNCKICNSVCDLVFGSVLALPKRLLCNTFCDKLYQCTTDCDSACAKKETRASDFPPFPKISDQTQKPACSTSSSCVFKCIGSPLIIFISGLLNPLGLVSNPIGTLQNSISSVKSTVDALVPNLDKEITNAIDTLVKPENTLSNALEGLTKPINVDKTPSVPVSIPKAPEEVNKPINIPSAPVSISDALDELLKPSDDDYNSPASISDALDDLLKPFDDDYNSPSSISDTLDELLKSIDAIGTPILPASKPANSNVNPTDIFSNPFNSGQTKPQSSKPNSSVPGPKTSGKTSLFGGLF